MPSNRKFGAVVRKLGHDDPLQVAEVMRVARLYGARPEIFRNVGWRTLRELASSVTSESQRKKFDALVLAGKRVSGAEIIRARVCGPLGTA